MNSVKFIGMDVHKKTITIAIAEEGSRESARVYGTINNEFDALDKFCRKCYPLQINLILSMKLVLVVILFTAI